MEILKRCRVEKLGITQQTMADRLGVSFHTVKAWEQGTRFIKITDLVNVSKAYCLTNIELLEYIKACSL